MEHAQHVEKPALDFPHRKMSSGFSANENEVLSRNMRSMLKNLPTHKKRPLINQ